MSPTGSAPDGAAATIAALPAPGRTAVVVVLTFVVIACLGAALAGLTRLLAVPARRHGAARSTFYLAAMPTPLAAPGRHRHRRRSALVRWTAWPNPLSRPEGETAPRTGHQVRAERQRARTGAHPAGREITPDRALLRARRRSRKAAQSRAAAPASRMPAAETADLVALSGLPASAGPDETQPADAASASPPAAGARPPRQRRRDVTPEQLAVQRRAREEFAAATTAADVLRHLADRGLDACAAQSAAVVLHLPTGVRIAALSDVSWPTQPGQSTRPGAPAPDLWVRRGCAPEVAAAAVASWRGLVQAWEASSAPPWPWTGGGRVRAHLRDGDRARAALAVPLRLGGRVVGAVLATRAAGADFSITDEDVLGRVTAAAADRLAELARLPLAPAGDAAPADDRLEDLLGSREQLMRELTALLPAAALPGWAPVLVAVRLHGADAEAVADGLGPVLRDTDRVYRWSDDELLVLLPDIARARARVVAHRIATCVRAVVANGADGRDGVPTVAWTAADCRSAVKVVQRTRRAVAAAEQATSVRGAIPAPRVTPERRPGARSGARP